MLPKPQHRFFSPHRRAVWDEEAHHPAGEGRVHRDEFAVGAPNPGHDVAGADVLALPGATVAQCALAGGENQPLVNREALTEDVVKRLPPGLERYWLVPEGLQNNAQFFTSSFHVKRTRAPLEAPILPRAPLKAPILSGAPLNAHCFGQRSQRQSSTTTRSARSWARTPGSSEAARRNASASASLPTDVAGRSGTEVRASPHRTRAGPTST